MKKSLLKTICILLLPALLLSGCWQEDPLEEESPVHPDQTPLTAEEKPPAVILPEQFSLP